MQQITVCVYMCECMCVCVCVIEVVKMNVVKCHLEHVQSQLLFLCTCIKKNLNIIPY